jgi:uncharacterized repeat protein (TIGR01451 family)
MKFRNRLLFALVVLASGLMAVAAPAESHRATHLGNPATRFAPPLRTTEDLRSRFHDEKLKPDFIEVLRQWDWQGNPADLFAAAATAEISEAPIAVGETLPFMSTRKAGKPVCLRNVLWAGREPAPAYAFNFVSNGRRYRCITPKACSNFLVADLGPEPRPALVIACSAPKQLLPGRPARVCITVVNSGNSPEPKVTVTLPVPDGAAATSFTDNGSISNGVITWEIANLAAMRGKEICCTLDVGAPGNISFHPAARGSIAGPARSGCETKVVGMTGILLEVIDLADPIEVDKEATYVIKVTNQGSAPGTNIRLVCTLPESEEYVSGKGDTTITAENGVLTTAVLPVLAPKAAATWEVTVKANQAADARFKVELTSDQFEKPIIESESTQLY